MLEKANLSYYVVAWLLLGLCLQRTVAELPEENQGCVCGVPTAPAADPFNRIVDGEDAEEGEIPWQVYVRPVLRNGTSIACGGTLVSDRHIITAAHCFWPPYLPSNVFKIFAVYGVLANPHTKIPNPKYEVAHAAIHPDSSVNVFKDIAVLTLKKPINWAENPTARPACLPNQLTIEDFINKTATVSGWGKFDYFNNTFPDRLKQVHQPILGKNNCGKYVGPDTDFPESLPAHMLCAGHLEGGRGQCSGDSGGPLTVHSSENNGAATLVGVVSWSTKMPNCASPLYPGVYVDVQHFVSSDWLPEQLKGGNTCPPPPAPPTSNPDCE